MKMGDLVKIKQRDGYMYLTNRSRELALDNMTGLVICSGKESRWNHMVGGVVPMCTVLWRGRMWSVLTGELEVVNVVD